MADLEGVIDDHSSSSGSSLHIPSPKKHKLKRARGKLCKYSKGQKRKFISSSSSSSSSNSSEPDSDHMVHKKKGSAKKKCLGYQKSRSVTNIHLLDVFQKHYENLVTITKSCPLSVCNKLFSSGFISEDTWNHVITGQDSQLKKASLLLCDIRAHLKVCPEMLVEFVKLLEQDMSFDFLTCQIKGEFNIAVSFALICCYLQVISK